jgi:hypothetical protein
MADKTGSAPCPTRYATNDCLFGVSQKRCKWPAIRDACCLRSRQCDRSTNGVMLTRSTQNEGSKPVLSHADYSYLMNHRPLWISNFIKPSSLILNSSNWQDSSFEILARLMTSKALSGFSRSALRIFSRSLIIRLLRFCMPVLTEYKPFAKPLNALKTTFAKWLETNPR